MLEKIAKKCLERHYWTLSIESTHVVLPRLA